MTEPFDALIREKAALRQRSKAARDAIAPERREAQGRALAITALPPLLEGGSYVVSSFWSMGSEIDPAHLEARLRRHGHTIALPVMSGRDQPLAFRLWQPGDPLVERIWGIREPTEGAPGADPDVLLVPLLAFDRSGHRLGYGGGYYDRTLASLRARRPVVAVGLAFEEQEVEEVPHGPRDARLDWVLTAGGPISCAV